MLVANVADLSLVPATDPTGHNQPCVEVVYTDAEGQYGPAGTVYHSAVFVFQHGGQKLALDINNLAEASKAIFETGGLSATFSGSTQAIPSANILVRQ